MMFPAFGDAVHYRELGEACANAMSGDGGSPWNARYDSLRPIGVVAYHSIPYLLLGDPVERSYFFLLLNLGWLVFALLLLITLFRNDVPERYSRLVSTAVVVGALLNLVPHIPVTLADLPSLALFLAAIHQSARVIHGHRGGYLYAGLLVAGATFFKQTYLAHGFFLLCVTLLFDPIRFSIRDRFVAAVKFGAGAAPLLLQVGWTYLHSGHLWFYDRGTTDLFRPMPNLEASYTALPKISAFMVQVANDVSYPTFVVLKAFRALFGFEWAVYGGYVEHSPAWVVSTGDIVKAWCLVLAYLVVALFTIVRGPRILRLLNALTLLMVVFLATTAHVELRFYILPRVVMWGTIAAWMASFAANRRRTPATE